MSHLGPRVSALLDGRLDPAEEERCWTHVHSCHTCRDLVEQEGWVKTQLAQLSFEDSQTSHDFKSALVGRCAAASGSALTPARFPTAGHRPAARRWSPSAAAPRARASSACWRSASPDRRARSAPAHDRPEPPRHARDPVVNVDDRSARGPVAPSRTPLAERLVAIREKIVP